MNQDRFARLRQLFQLPPSEDSWGKMVGLFRHWSSEDVSLAVEYAERHLEGWEDRLRRADSVEAEEVWWPLVRHLDLNFANTDESLAALESPKEALAGLTGLTPGQMNRFHRVFRNLAENRALPPLEFLDLYFYPMTDANLRLLLRAPFVRTLQWLRVRGDRLTATGWRDLFSAPWNATLKELQLHDGDLGFESMAALAQAPGLQLQSLLLEFIPQDLMAGIVLASAPSLRNIESLRLRFQLPSEVGRAFLLSPLLQHVHTLEWRPGLWSHDVWELFRSSPHLGQLRHLTMERYELEERSWRVFSETPALQQLQTLKLNSSGLYAAYNDWLEFVDFPALSELSLDFNALRRSGCRALHNNTSLSSLRRLSLKHCELENEDVEEILAASWFSQLEYLNLRSNNLTPSFKEWMEDNYPAIQLELYEVG